MYYAIVEWYDNEAEGYTTDITFWEKEPTVKQARLATAAKKLLSGYYEDNGYTFEQALIEEDTSLEEWLKYLYDEGEIVFIGEVPEKRWDDDVPA